MFLIGNHPREKTSAILFLFISISFSPLNVSYISQDICIQVTSHKGFYGMFLYLFLAKNNISQCLQPQSCRNPEYFFSFVLFGFFVCNYFRALLSHFHKDFDSYILQNSKYSVITLIGYKMTTTFCHLEAFRFRLKYLLFLRYFSSNLEKKIIWIIIIISLSLRISTANDIPAHSVIPMVLKY